MDSKNVVELTTDNWDQQVVNSDQPVVVDFWAPWCVPCRKLLPIIDQVAEKYAGRAKVGKVNVDEHPGLATEYSVSGIPRILFFKGDRKPRNQITGIATVPQLSKILDELLAG